MKAKEAIRQLEAANVRAAVLQKVILSRTRYEVDGRVTAIK